MLKKPCATWQPASFTRDDIYVILVSLATQVFIRTWDYGTGRDHTGGLSLVEKAAPLPVWGAIFGIELVALMIGVITRKHLLVWLGHILLGCTYFILFVGIVLSVIGAPYLDGVRNAGVLITPMVLHQLFAWRMGPRPLSQSDVLHYVEEVVSAAPVRN